MPEYRRRRHSRAEHRRLGARRGRYGARVRRSDGLEHLEPFIETARPILVLTSRKDARTFDLLRSIRYDGLYAGHAEGLKKLPAALQQVIQRRLYVSPTMLPNLKRPKNITLDALTEKKHRASCAMKRRVSP